MNPRTRRLGDVGAARRTLAKATLRQQAESHKPGSGATIDADVRKAFFDCWVGKITERFESFDEFKKNQRHADVAKFRDECDTETKFTESAKPAAKSATWASR